MTLKTKRLIASAGLTVSGTGLFVFANVMHGQAGILSTILCGIIGGVGVVFFALALLAFLSAIMDDD